MPAAMPPWTSPLLDLLFDDALAGRCLVAPDGSILRANGAWLRLAGLSLDDVLGANFVELFPDTREVHDRARAGHVVEVPCPSRGVQGRETWCDESIAPVPMAGGTGLLITTRAVRRDAASHETELALRASEARFRTMADESPVILWVTDARGNKELVNRTYRDFFGVTLEEVEGTKWRPLVHPEDAAGYLEGFVEAIRERSPFTGEARVRRKDGVWRWIASYGQPRHTETGEFLGHVGVSLDITDRKDAEETLRGREERARAQAAELEAILNCVGDGVIVYDRDGHTIRSTPAADRILGVPLSERRAPVQDRIMHQYEIASEDGRPLQSDDVVAFRAAIRGETIRGEVLRIRSGRNEPRWISLNATPLLLDGKHTGAVISLSDVTERRRADEALRRYELLASMTGDIVLFLRREDGHIIEANAAAVAAYGYGREELLALTINDLRAPETLGATQQQMSIADTKGILFETVHRRKDGGTFDVEVRSVGATMNGARTLMSVVRDVTQRKREQEALREGDRRKTEFLGVLSHELRNPLATIRNSIYLLERAAPSSEEAVRAKEIIQRQTAHLSSLVDDLLDITRISRGKIALRRTRLDLREIVRKTTEDLRSVFARAGVELRLDLMALGPLWIDADPRRMSQVLGNLLHNSVKFTPSGGSVTVSATARDGGAELCVRDDGLGMDPGSVERMFEPFAQADRTLARTKGGLGLGLALVKSLVELHGGAVEARSDGIGRGAEFLVRLPLATAPGAETRSGPVVAPEPRPRAILVIEDNVDAGQSLADVLELEGHRVRISRDGRRGLELARELRPDVVLCDIGLPDLQGYEVARALRRDEAFRSTRLIALSGYAQPEDVQRSREAGFDAHVAKPPDIDALMKLLANDT